MAIGARSGSLGARVRKPDPRCRHRPHSIQTIVSAYLADRVYGTGDRAPSAGHRAVAPLITVVTRGDISNTSAYRVIDLIPISRIPFDDVELTRYGLVSSGTSLDRTPPPASRRAAPLAVTDLLTRPRNPTADWLSFN